MSQIQDKAYTKLALENQQLKDLLKRALNALKASPDAFEAMSNSAVANRVLIDALRHATRS